MPAGSGVIEGFDVVSFNACFTGFGAFSSGAACARINEMSNAFTAPLAPPAGALPEHGTAAVHSQSFARRRAWRPVAVLLAAAALRLAAQSNEVIYTDSLQGGWQNWSWATVNFANTNPVHSGTDSISVVCAGYQALMLHQYAFDSTLFTNLTFWINGGPTGGQQLQVQASLDGGTQPNPVSLSPLSTNWQQITLSLAALGAANQPGLQGFVIQNRTSAQLQPFYMDDVTLLVGAAPATNPGVAITIDAQSNRHPISPQIYGVAFATSNQLSDFNFTMNRSGGNNESRYNWQINAHNLDADYYFESYPDTSSTPGATADSFVANSKNGGAHR